MWIVLATSSFPVPLSPVTNTLASVGATRSISSYTFCIASDRPTIVPKRPNSRS